MKDKLVGFIHDYKIDTEWDDVTCEIWIPFELMDKFVDLFPDQCSPVGNNGAYIEHYMLRIDLTELFNAEIEAGLISLLE